VTRNGPTDCPLKTFSPEIIWETRTDWVQYIAWILSLHYSLWRTHLIGQFQCRRPGYGQFSAPLPRDGCRRILLPHRAGQIARNVQNNLQKPRKFFPQTTNLHILDAMGSTKTTNQPFPLLLILTTYRRIVVSPSLHHCLFLLSWFKNQCKSLNWSVHKLPRVL
jgi:hypothetical protein